MNCASVYIVLILISIIFMVKSNLKQKEGGATASTIAFAAAILATVAAFATTFAALNFATFATITAAFSAAFVATVDSAKAHKISSTIFYICLVVAMFIDFVV